MENEGVPALRSRWPRAPIEELWEFLNRPVELRLARLFECFLAAKLVLEPLLALGPVAGRTGGALPPLAALTAPDALVGLVSLGLVAASRRTAWLGLAGLLGLRVWDLARDFPLTGNHIGLEVVLLFALLVYRPVAVDGAPAAPGVRAPLDQRVDGRALRLTSVAIATVYFWSGVQKLFHGYYLNGEFFTLLLFVDEGSQIGGLWVASLGAIARTLGWTAPQAPTAPDWLEPSAFALEPWAVAFLVAQSWLTVAAELAFPLLLVHPRTRALGRLLLLPTALAIAAISGETGFALTNFACLLLFFPRQARWAYPASFALVLGVHFVRASGLVHA